MKTLIASVSFLVLGIGGATAADLPMKAAPYVAPVPVISWTGCYLGAGGGYGFFNQKRQVIAPVGDFATAGSNGTSTFAMSVDAVPGAVISQRDNFGGEGWLATGQVGCDYQFSGNWLVGAFGDGTWADLKGDRDLLGVFNGQEKMKSSWAAGGRLGYLITPSLLTFVSGGYTQAEFSGVAYANGFTTTAMVVTVPQATIALSTQGQAGLGVGSHTYDGFFIGGGAEYALGWLPGLFWKTEYRYADYRSVTQNVICAICTAASPGPVGLTGLAERTRTTVQTIRSELVWRFNWGGGPVVAKY
jgi:outer membrane immunogenic protein